MRNVVRSDLNIPHRKADVNELHSPTNKMSKCPNIGLVQADAYVGATEIVTHDSDLRAPIVVITSSPPLSPPDVPTYQEKLTLDSHG